MKTQVSLVSFVIILSSFSNLSTLNGFIISSPTQCHHQHKRTISYYQHEEQTARFNRKPIYFRNNLHAVAVDTSSENESSTSSRRIQQESFDLSKALFCGGLAFDAYVEPEPSSSRWERGSKGLQVAFCSPSYTRQLYKGLVEIKILKCTGLPSEDDSAAERLLSGRGVDACLLVAALEGSWKEDIEMLEKEQFHEGVLELAGAAHVSRSSTCWATVDRRKAELNAKLGRPLPYHVPATWGKGAQAVWPESEPPFYLYVQDPATARLVFTVLDDDKLGEGKAIGSTYKRLADIIPQASLSQDELVEQFKQKIMQQIQETGSTDVLNDMTKLEIGGQVWKGVLPLTSKPRKKDKNSQIMAAAAAGAMVAGPMGAAAGAVLGSLYEGSVQGRIELQLKYLPIPQVPVTRKTYIVKGGMPGIDWGSLYFKYNQKRAMSEAENIESQSDAKNLDMSLLDLSTTNDLEHCFFVNHQKTGATCAVYRSLEKKLVVVSFRGTCQPVDLVTDTSLAQEAWIEGEDLKLPETCKIHVGFKNSMNSIARRLKELVLATPGPGESIADYDIYVTGHSLGGALATLFTADIGQFGIDAGRALPQLAPSEPWWKAIANTIMGKEANEGDSAMTSPPRPRSLRLYNFGSPRVGNLAFANMFDSLIAEGKINAAYRVVNGDDVVARMPRTMNALALGSVGYEHVGTTVLITQPQESDANATPLLWIEGVSDKRSCPVRDGSALVSPLKEGSLIGDLVSTTFGSNDNEKDREQQLSWAEKFSVTANKLSDRVKNISISDLASVVGIDKNFSEREMKLIQSLLEGKALAHHMEDQYYAGMGRASGYRAQVGEELVPLEETS